MNLILGIHMSILVLILNFNQDKKKLEDTKGGNQNPYIEEG